VIAWWLNIWEIYDVQEDAKSLAGRDFPPSRKVELFIGVVEACLLRLVAGSLINGNEMCL
jgi:hypothetical protein